ncbi:response regulator [Telmatospirillum sp. J64-1]|uniref:response regulator n=1 Tax=Telmatospirillum sp. J64-1 TaxID=2502183 RepID=UPI00115D5739|nr:response regulator [Telmatospirillum sp. J64-1]
MSARSPLVAVIDDDPYVLQALQLLLELRGFVVIAGESEAPVLAHLRGGGPVPHLIISDYRLRQGHTGIQAVRQIRSQCGQTIPGLLITGDTSGELLAQARKQGLAVLQKPVLPPQLEAAMALALS